MNIAHKHEFFDYTTSESVTKELDVQFFNIKYGLFNNYAPKIIKGEEKNEYRIMGHIVSAGGSYTQYEFASIFLDKQRKVGFISVHKPIFNQFSSSYVAEESQLVAILNKFLDVHKK